MEGLSNIDSTPMDVSARLLPAPKLLFAENRTADPELSGEYYIQDKKVHTPPPSAGRIPYGIIITGYSQPRFDYMPPGRCCISFL